MDGWMDIELDCTVRIGCCLDRLYELDIAWRDCTNWVLFELIVRFGYFLEGLYELGINLVTCLPI
jgi:hypothetical protein